MTREAIIARILANRGKVGTVGKALAVAARRGQ